MTLSAAEIIHAARMVHAEHGEPLTVRRFCRYAGIPERQVYQHFRSWYEVREAIDLPRVMPHPRKIPEEQLLEEFHRLTQKLKRFPTVGEFVRHSRYSYHVLWDRIGRWNTVKHRYREWLEDQQIRIAVERSLGPDRNPQPPSEPARDVRWLRDQWLGLRVGFETQSRQFEGRDPGQCDLLVVLEHDWPQCPVPVLELRSVAPGCK